MNENKKYNFDRQKRNYGIDSLRLIAMFMVVLLHVLGQGGILSATKGFKNAEVWFWEISAYCAVDCYAIISGFVGYSEIEKKYPYEKFLKFWLQVFTYSFGITLIMFLIKPELVGIKELFLSIFPIASKQYWYASSYAALFFLIPWINKLVRSCSKKEISSLVFTLMAVFSVYGMCTNTIWDSFSLAGGYSVIWLVILYIIGAWMKKCDIPNRLKNKKLIIGTIGFILFIWCIRIVVSESAISWIFVGYTNIMMVFIAFALVCIYSKISLGKRIQRFVKCFSPAAFGVYLIHTNLVIFNNILAGAFTWIADIPSGLISICVVILSLIIFAVCLLIEKVRLSVFRVLKINQSVEMMGIVLVKQVKKSLNFIMEVHNLYERD